jgi:hypothetical protein
VSRADIISRELAKLERREAALERRSDRRTRGWKGALESRIPPKAADGVRAAFAKAFSILLERGSGWIERGCHPEELIALYSVRDSAVDTRGRRAELCRLCSGARRANAANTALTALEGLALGALGIGLPDILIFLGMLLRGIYTTAMSYGFDCSTPAERLLILKIMQCSVTCGDERRRLSEEIDVLMISAHEPDEAELRSQTEQTASAFATELLAIKFLQGLPIIGVVGGAANPLYYRRVMACAELKYKKRYLLGKIKSRPDNGGTARKKLK